MTLRAAELHNVLAVIEGAKINPKPKPVHIKTKHKHQTGICPQCGRIFVTRPEHEEDCPKEIDVIVFRKHKTERQMLDAANEVLC